jgi:hypothetical protein
MEPEESPDAAWVAALAATSLPAAERAVREAAGERQLFAHLEKEHRSEGRPSYVEIDAPLELQALVRLLRPRHVVEVGVSSGVSSAYLLNGLERNGAGTLHSVDLPKSPRSLRPGPARASWTIPEGRSSGWAVPDRLRKRWDLRLGDKADLLPVLAAELPRIDLFVYDVPHDDARSGREFRALDRRMPVASVAIVDHGPGGGLCAALRRWSRDRGTVPVCRTGLGLFGMRCGPRRRRGRARQAVAPPRVARAAT